MVSKAFIDNSRDISILSRVSFSFSSRIVSLGFNGRFLFFPDRTGSFKLRPRSVGQSVSNRVLRTKLTIVR